MSTDTACDKLMKYIQEEMNRVEYGKIIVELNGNSDKVDIITQQRQRFQKEKKSKFEGKSEIKLDE